MYSNKIKKSVLIVSHDAGGAEVLSAWVTKHPENRYSYVLEGPAVSIFSARLEEIDNNVENDLIQLIAQSDFILTSTSWSSDLEKKAIRSAKRNKVKVASYLDHWIHYQERFYMDDGIVLPDEIWVGDQYAKEIAEDIFPQQKVLYQKNEYFVEISEKVQRMAPKNVTSGLRILFLSQPLDKAGCYQFTDWDIFNLLIQSIRTLQQREKVGELRIRVHSGDDREKYEKWIKKSNNIDIRISTEKDLLTDCVHSDWVVGAFSMAMVIGLFAKRKVFSCLPGGSDRLLPHKEIIDFRSYVESL